MQDRPHLQLVVDAQGLPITSVFKLRQNGHHPLFLWCACGIVFIFALGRNDARNAVQEIEKIGGNK